MWNQLFANPADSAHRKLAAAGWDTDRELVDGEGMFKFVGRRMFYVTDLSGGHPRLSEPLLVTRMVSADGGQWWEEVGEPEELTLEEVLRKY